MSDILKTDDKTKTNIHYEGGLSEGKIRDKKQETQAHIMDSPRPIKIQYSSEASIHVQYFSVGIYIVIVYLSEVRMRDFL